ncbi:MAG: respiratory nitrate reductase subunit gamma [Candidatus Eiseniibacteriota bacterium]|jgi:nitrate reductase gamma subunit
MYEFASGPLVWIAFAIFVGGSAYRIVSTVREARKDKVVLPYMSWKYGLRSILHWIVPFGARNMRLRPFFTVMSFVFHACLVLTPVFTLGHVSLWRQSWGLSWWTLPGGLSTLMTVIVVSGSIVFALRRLADPTVRYVTTPSDFFLLAVVVAPFATGLMAYFQVLDYTTILVVHIWSGALWLAVVPFTRIVHMIFFPLTRGYMGSEFGFVRNARDW